LTSIIAQSHENYVLFVVDSGSKDDTLTLVASCSDPRIETILNSQNVGVAEGNNQGIKASQAAGCDLVLLINNDIECDEDLLEKLIRGLDEHNADMIVPKTMYFDEPDKIWCAGGYFDALRGFVSGHYGFQQTDRGQFDQPRAIQYAPTCCMLIKRHVFDIVGIMDARYFVYFDDTDFCFRAYRAGVKLMYLPSAVLYHKVGSLTSGDQSPFTFEYMNRNRAYFIGKNLPPAARIYSIVFSELSYVLRFLRRRDSFNVFLLRHQLFQRGLRMVNEEHG